MYDVSLHQKSSPRLEFHLNIQSVRPAHFLAPPPSGKKTFLKSELCEGSWLTES